MYSEDFFAFDNNICIVFLLEIDLILFYLKYQLRNYLCLNICLRFGHILHHMEMVTYNIYFSGSKTQLENIYSWTPSIPHLYARNCRKSILRRNPQNHSRFLNPLLTKVALSCHQLVLIDWFNNHLVTKITSESSENASMHIIAIAHSLNGVSHFTITMLLLSLFLL